MPKSAQGAYFLLVAIREKLALCVIYAMFFKMENGLKQTRKTTQGSIFQLSCITYQYMKKFLDANISQRIYKNRLCYSVLQHICI